MNNLYSWHNEVMVRLEMEDIKREIDSIRLIHDAALSNPGPLERTILAISNALIKLGQHLHDLYTYPHQAYEITTSKFAS